MGTHCPQSLSGVTKKQMGRGPWKLRGAKPSSPERFSGRDTILEQCVFRLVSLRCSFSIIHFMGDTLKQRFAVTFFSEMSY